MRTPHAEMPEYGALYSHDLQDVLARLDKTYQAFCTVRRQRQDFQYKVAVALLRQYDTIYYEDVQTANMP